MKQLRSKVQECHSLLEKRKHTPALRILQHRKMTRQIDALTKEIEKLKDEKALLLNRFSCTDDQGMVKVKQHAASMEFSLKKLNQGEIRYRGEMDATLAQYVRLLEQSTDMDTTELETVRQAIRPGKEYEAVQHLQTTYRKKFDSSLLTQSRKDIAELLDEVMEPVSIRERLRQPVEQTNKQRHINRCAQER